MEEISNNIKKVKEAFSIADDTYDKYFTLCEKIIIDKILDNINCEELPERLNSLVVEFLINEYVSNQDGIGKGTTVVASASDVNQSVSFSNTTLSNINNQADIFLDNNELILSGYRKIRW